MAGMLIMSSAGCKSALQISFLSFTRKIVKLKVDDSWHRHDGDGRKSPTVHQVVSGKDGWSPSSHDEEPDSPSYPSDIRFSDFLSNFAFRIDLKTFLSSLILCVCVCVDSGFSLSDWWSGFRPSPRTCQTWP